MNWIDYRKLFDMVPHSWKVDRNCLVLQLFIMWDSLISCEGMEDWKIELTSFGQSMRVVKINEGIYHIEHDSVSFVLEGQVSEEVLKTISCFWSDLWLLVKSYEQIDSVLYAVHTFSTDIGMGFGIKRCKVLILKREIKLLRRKAFY